MKFRIILFLYVITGRYINAQTGAFCSTTEIMKNWFSQHPEKVVEFNRLQNDAKTKDSIASLTNYFEFRMLSSPVYTIPVVFHILHLNGPENISDAQVQDAIDILNRDYRKLNSDTSATDPVFKALAADVNIEFRLATKDDNGNCTKGIVRHYDTRTNWTANMADYIYTWSSNKYLNIYVVYSINNGSAGYTFLPGSAPGYADAIVIRHDYIGSIGTSVPYRSRALTHEVGHWFNLQHVWGSTNNAGVSCGDDAVSDTPITKGFYWCNLAGTAVCTPPGKENIQNYMDYAYCPTMFTIGQAARMTNSALGVAGGRNNLHSNSNLIATGVINPAGPCAPIADFCSVQKEVCVNVSTQFIDLSYNGNVTSWQWTFSDGYSSTPNAQSPTATFTVSGIKEVKLKVSNSIASDSLTKKPIVILAGSGSGILNQPQGFETLTFPDSIWITNVPQVGAGWIINNSTGASGSHCMMIDNYFDSPGEEAHLYTPMFDVSTIVSPALTFDLAYSQNPSGSNDRLRVYYSTDCAGSWNTLYNKSGSTLHTLGGGNYATGAFLVPTPAQWRNEIISLSSATNLLLKFEFIKDSINPGNNIFIDNINIQSVPGVNENILEENVLILYPNPGQGNITLLINSGMEGNCKVELTDISGKLIWENEVIHVKKGNRIIMPGNTLKEGMYFIKLIKGNNFYVKKLIID